MEKFTSRDRDKGRKYKSGSAKRKFKSESEKKLNELSKITSFLRKENASEIVECLQALDTLGCTPPRCSSSSTPCGEKEITIIASPVDTSGDEEIDVRSDVDMGTAEEVTVTIACEEENTGIDSYPNDIGLWPNEINNTFRDYWLTRVNKECQNNDSDFKNSAKTEHDRTRHCTASLFTHKHSLTGEILDLSSWLCYSESTGKVYCFPCKLLSTTESYFNRGFDDWKHGHEKVEAHSKYPNTENR